MLKHKSGTKPPSKARRISINHKIPRLPSLSHPKYSRHSLSTSTDFDDDLAPIPNHILHQRGLLKAQSTTTTMTTQTTLHTSQVETPIHSPSDIAPEKHSTVHPPSPQHHQLHRRNIFYDLDPDSTFSQQYQLHTTQHEPESDVAESSDAELRHAGDIDPAEAYTSYIHEDNTPLWNKPVRTVFLVKKWQSKSASKYSNHIAQFLTSMGVQVFIEPSCVNDFEQKYPTVFDLMHHTDISFSTHLPEAFPAFADSHFSQKRGSFIHEIIENHENLMKNASDLSTTTNPDNHIQEPQYYNRYTPLYAKTVTQKLEENIPLQSFWANSSHFPPRDATTLSQFASLSQRECIPFVRKYEKWQDFIDVVVAIGGDGTLLHVSTLFGHKVPPVLGFSCGSFGFLMPFNPDRAEQAITKLLNGQLHCQQRNRVFFRIQTQQERNRNLFPINQFDPECYHLLNEVTLKHSYDLDHSASVSDIECRVNGHLLARYQGDGLILASPTGSTAYSMAAGGSIIHPSMSCLLITPIAPMTLSGRPVVIPSNNIISLTPNSSPVLLEGKFGRVVHPGETIHVSTSKFPIPVFCRRNATADFMHDLGSRMNYARMVRMVREDDLLDDTPQGKTGSFLSKRLDDDHTRQ